MRFKTRGWQFVIDTVVLCIAFLLAVFLRYDWQSPPAEDFRRLVFVMPYAILLQYAMLTAFGVTRFSWRYISLRDVVLIFRAIAVSALVLVAIRLLAPLATKYFYPARYGIVPFGVLAANFLLAFLGIIGVRVLRRLSGEYAASRSHMAGSAGEWVPTVLIGAGQGGVLVAQEIARRPDLRIQPVAFVDDDPKKIGAVVQGIPVMGSLKDLQSICSANDIDQAIITISSAPGQSIRRIAEVCKSIGLEAKIIPGTYQIVDGRVNLARIRNVAIEDLLRRDIVKLDSEQVRALVQDRVVLITGAGGSIGAELCRQVAAYQPEQLVLVEQAENNLFMIHREIQERFAACEVLPCVADITDSIRMSSIFQRFKPGIVFHAAAHKHVPMMERNPCEAVKNNVVGTQIVADLADRFGVSKFVMISTDKAVNPTSMMGATKRAAELYVQALSATSKTEFATVRFGNVLGSTGSVIPIFKEQIEAGGPVTVTHPDMKRYFMTIPEAVQLVMQAGALSEGGEIFVLDMGEPIRIVDLATDLIRLSGFEPDVDIRIEFTGVRPGEKLFEELSVADESLGKTKHPMIYVGEYGTPPLSSLREALNSLGQLAVDNDDAAVMQAIGAVVPEYQGPEERS